MPTYDAILNGFATLFVTIDPPGLVPIFLAITVGMTASERRSVAFRGILIGFLILVGAAFMGTAILETLGITIHAFRVSGGLLLFYIAFEMIFEKRQERHEQTSKRLITRDDIVNIAVFPLAIPLIAGPGAISATILLASDFGGTVTGYATLLGIMGAILALLLVLLLLAEKFDRLLGETGRSLITRLMGVLLAALSVQFVVDGLKALLG